MRSLVVSTVFLMAVVCVCRAASEELQNKDYSQLDGNLKTFVDLTITRANQQLHYGHLNFEGTGQMAWVPSDGGVAIDVRLRATTCTKSTRENGHKHRPQCPFKRVQVRCMVCSRSTAGVALFNNDYLIDCVRRKDENMRHAIWDRQCNPSLTQQFRGNKGGLGGPPPPGTLEDLSAPKITAFVYNLDAAVQYKPEGLQVSKGTAFDMRCYSQARLPNSVFLLTLNGIMKDSTTGESGVAHFHFSAADLSDRGVYRCAYLVTVDYQTSTFWSDPFSLTVYYYDSDDYSVDE